MVVPIMTVMPIATNPEDAIDGTHRAADTGADRTANDGAHRACRAATLARAVTAPPSMPRTTPCACPNAE